jgi:PadR family transcriptional regulator, regulatory protein PadR
MPVRRPRVLTLSAKESLILELLVEGGELYGLQLVAASRRRLKRGTVYVTLGRMEKKRLIRSRLEAPPPEAGGMPRRVYSPTADGRRVLAAWNQLAKVMGRLNPEFAR